RGGSAGRSPRRPARGRHGRGRRVGRRSAPAGATCRPGERVSAGDGAASDHVYRTSGGPTSASSGRPAREVPHLRTSTSAKTVPSAVIESAAWWTGVPAVSCAAAQLPDRPEPLPLSPPPGCSFSLLSELSFSFSVSVPCSAGSLAGAAAVFEEPEPEPEVLAPAGC